MDHDEESNKLETPSPKNKRLSKDPAGFESSNGMYSTPYVSTSMPEQVTIELKNDEKKQNHNEVPSQEPTFSENWTHLILRLKSPILRILFAITGHASKNPKSYVLGCLLLSTILMGSGFARGINLDVNQDEAWTPEGSKPLAHGEWLEDESGFPQIPKWFLIFIHADGKNLLGQDGVARTFEALGVFRETKGYQEICAQSDEAHGMLLRGNMTCAIYSASAFWNHSVSIFNEEISSDQEAIVALSAEHFPDGQHVDPQMIYGLPLQGDDGILESVLAYATNIAIPPIDDESSEFEKEATARLLDLQEQWDEDPDNLFRLEFFGYDSFTEEFTRAIVKDIPLLPVVFVIMSILSCVFYAKWDIIQSRSLLGFGAVVTVLLGIMCGYGLMFLSGVAFTSLTQVSKYCDFEPYLLYSLRTAI